jgi:hypothetical protein
VMIDRLSAKTVNDKIFPQMVSIIPIYNLAVAYNR